MATKAQHVAKYRAVPSLLKNLRLEANLMQREIGERLKKPQSWVYNCETSNRRVDITEFVAWCGACDVDPVKAFQQLLDEL
jgi:transcriptional regulator with XRE-family HTH domain